MMTTSMKSMKGVAMLLTGAMMLAACAGTDQNTTRRTVGGAALGAASGAAIGAIAGHAGRGAAIGAIAGATGGLVYDQISKEQRHR